MKDMAPRLSRGDLTDPYAWLRWIGMISLISLAIVSTQALSSKVHAEDLKFTQSKVRFNSYKQQLTRLQSAPQSRYLVGELTSLNQWVSQAERELAEDEDERFMMLVDLVQLQIQLIDVSIEELIARERIQVVEAEAQDLEARAKREREAISALEKEMAEALSAPQRGAAPAQPTPQAGTTAPRAAPAPAPAPAPALAPLQGGR